MEYTKQDHMELVQKTYQNQTFQNTTFERSDIDNCKIERLTFYNCCFDRSSLTCIRAKDCVFEQCEFRNVDLISGDFAQCVFRSCDFSLANIGDNMFYQCEFNASNFTGAAIKENEFVHASFVGISLRGSETTLNTFRQTSVLNSEFGNCTVDYNIVEECLFQDSSLNVETLGTFFGFDLNSLHNCRFLSLGEESLESNQETLFDNIRSQFEREGRYIEVFIIDINRSLNNLIPGTEQLCAQIKGKLLAGSFVPSNQLQFLFNVFKELYRRKHLSFLALHYLKNGIQDILESVSPESKFYEKFILLYNNLNLLHNSMAADLTSLADWDFFEIDRPITVRFKFAEKPSVSIVDMLENCYTHVFGTPPETPSTILSEQPGSYLVFLQTTVYTLLAFRICTYLLAGSIKELVKIRANASLLVKKKLPRKYYLAATKPDTTVTVPQAIATLLTSVIKKVLPSSLQDIPVVDISDDNLKEVLEVSEEDVPSKNHASVK